MVDGFVSGTSIMIATLHLGRNDDWKSLGEGHERELSVATASIRGHIYHHGIRCVIFFFENALPKVHPQTFALGVFSRVFPLHFPLSLLPLSS
jgi:hypothetical protein